MFTFDGDEIVWAAKRTISISMLSVRFLHRSVERKRQRARGWAEKCFKFMRQFCCKHLFTTRNPFFCMVYINRCECECVWVCCVAGWMEHVLLECWTNVQSKRLQCKYDNNTTKPNFRFKMLAKFFVTLLSSLFVPSLMACIFATYALEHATTKKRRNFDFSFFVSAFRISLLVSFVFIRRSSHLIRFINSKLWQIHTWK